MRWNAAKPIPVRDERRRIVRFAWKIQIMQAKKVWLEFYIQNQIYDGSCWVDTDKELACWYY